MWTDKLRILDACDSAIKWASAYPTAQAAWDECGRPEWMIWLALKTVSEQVVKQVAVRMAPLVRHQVFEMDAAWTAADAIIAVWTAIRHTAAGPSRNDTYRRTADIVRELIPNVPL